MCQVFKSLNEKNLNIWKCWTFVYGDLIINALHLEFNIYKCWTLSSVQHFEMRKCGGYLGGWICLDINIFKCSTLINVQHLQVSSHFNLFKPVEHQKLWNITKSNSSSDKHIEACKLKIIFFGSIHNFCVTWCCVFHFLLCMYIVHI